MSKEAKYYDLLDKLAEAIKDGKSADKIERIKQRIEEIEYQIYLKQMKGKWYVEGKQKNCQIIQTIRQENETRWENNE